MEKRTNKWQPREQGGPVTLKNSRYQPSRDELRADVTIKATPKQVMKSVVRRRPVRFEK